MHFVSESEKKSFGKILFIRFKIRNRLSPLFKIRFQSCLSPFCSQIWHLDVVAVVNVVVVVDADLKVVGGLIGVFVVVNVFAVDVVVIGGDVIAAAVVCGANFVVYMVVEVVSAVVAMNVVAVGTDFNFKDVGPDQNVEVDVGTDMLFL